MDFKFTIFTPVYNGEKFIERVFNSLQNSTYKNFEWIIINDGSTDNSHEIVQKLISTVNWDITYINWQQNKGKHYAWNYAVSIAKGDLWLPIDCDDAFTYEALSFYNEKWNELYKDKTIYGIETLCFDSQSKQIIGTQYPFDGLKSTFLELKYKYHIKGEKWSCIRMEYIKNVPFPEIPGHFFTGPYIWNILGKQYKITCYNKALREYFVEPTSICHKRALNRDTLYMFIYYDKFLLRNFGLYILKNDKFDFFRIIKEDILIRLKYLIMKLLKAKEIIKE